MQPNQDPPPAVTPAWSTLRRQRPVLSPRLPLLGRPGVAPTADLAARQRDFLTEADKVLGLAPLTPSQRLDGAPAPDDSDTPLHAGWDVDPTVTAKEFVKRIQLLGIGWRLSGRADYLTRAKAELQAMCGFPSWHPEIFLATARIAYGVAIGHDWLYDALSDAERAAITGALLDKAIAPGLQQLAAPAFWVNVGHNWNWNLVCNAGLMIAALAAEEVDPERTHRLFELCLSSIETGLAGYAHDGGWPEGPGYWALATEYLSYLLDALQGAFGSTLGLDRRPGLAHTDRFRLHGGGPSGRLFNYADSEAHQGGAWLLLWLAAHFGHPVDAWFDHSGPQPPDPMDLVWDSVRPRSPSSDHLVAAATFRAPTVEVAAMRGAWTDPHTTYVAIKGGSHRLLSHQHLDLGSFVVDALGHRWACDLGPDDYGIPNYFDPAVRARLYRTATIGHNTLVIDGACQPAAVVAPIIGYSCAPALSVTVIDLSAAYPSCARLVRGCALIAGRHVVIVDEIVPGPAPIALAWQMHTEASPALDGVAAVLSLAPKGAAAGAPPDRLHVRILGNGGAGFTQAPATPTYLPPCPAGAATTAAAPCEDPNDGVVKLVIRLDALAAPTRVAVLLSPDEVDGSILPDILRQPLASWTASA